MATLITTEIQGNLTISSGNLDNSGNSVGIDIFNRSSSSGLFSSAGNPIYGCEHFILNLSNLPNMSDAIGTANVTTQYDPSTISYTYFGESGSVTAGTSGSFVASSLQLGNYNTPTTGLVGLLAPSDFSGTGSITAATASSFFKDGFLGGSTIYAAYLIMPTGNKEVTNLISGGNTTYTYPTIKVTINGNTTTYTYYGYAILYQQYTQSSGESTSTYTLVYQSTANGNYTSVGIASGSTLAFTQSVIFKLC